MSVQLLRFGSHHIDLDRRELLRNGSVIPIGAKAFDVLIALFNANGSVVSRDNLIEQVWSGRIINDNTIEAQIHAIRRSLGPDKHLLRTATGRGYFLVRRGAETPSLNTNLRSEISDLVAREGLSELIADRLRQNRLVTLVGPGGIGKTRLATAVGNEMLASFADGVWFVELAPVDDEELLVTAISCVFRDPFLATENLQELSEVLRARDILLILDNCEHLVAKSAEVAIYLLSVCPKLKILATTREAFGFDGEQIIQVPPLALPLGDESADIQAQAPAARLFLSRFHSLAMTAAPTTEDMTAISEICRRVDGIPLALEMAAAAAATIGVREALRRIENSSELLGQTRRTTIPRQQTMEATIAWSYNLLQPAEQEIFRRLGIMAGPFTLEVARTLLGPDAGDVASQLSSLVAKSLIKIENRDQTTCFLLLETIRAFARRRMMEAGDDDEIAQRHARCFLTLFQTCEREVKSVETHVWATRYRLHMNNARSALDWAFSDRGDATLGAALVVAIEPLWLHFSLVDELLARVRQAFARRPPGTGYTGDIDMKLQTALGSSLLYIQGPGAETMASLRSALMLADKSDNYEYQLRCLWGLCAAAMNAGKHAEPWDEFTRLTTEIHRHGGPTERLIATRAAGAVRHLVGDQVGARQHLGEFLAAYEEPKVNSPTKRFNFDQQSSALAVYARVHWLQGDQDTGNRLATEALHRALGINHVHSICHALAQAAIPLALDNAQYDSADRLISDLYTISSARGLMIWNIWASAYRASYEMTLSKGSTGVVELRNILNAHLDLPFSVYQSGFIGDLARAYAEMGDWVEAHRTIESAIARSQRNQELWCLPELMRISAEIAIRSERPDGVAFADDLLIKATALASEQGAFKWSARIAQTRRELGL